MYQNKKKGNLYYKILCLLPESKQFLFGEELDKHSTEVSLRRNFTSDYSIRIETKFPLLVHEIFVKTILPTEFRLTGSTDLERLRAYYKHLTTVKDETATETI